MNNGKFLSTLYVLASILPILSSLSKAFQKSVVNFSCLAPSLESVKAQLKEMSKSEIPVQKFQDATKILIDTGLVDFAVSDFHITQMKTTLLKYCEALITNIEDRFQESTPILAALSIFDPMIMPTRLPDITDYGRIQIAIIAQHYYPEDQDT